MELYINKTYILTLSDNIICTSKDNKFLIELSYKIKKDLDNIENTFNIEKDILINSGKYPISDIGVEAPVYSEVLCKLFKKLKKNIWKNKEYQYLINLGLKEVNYCQKASWCKFKIIDSKEISNDKY